MAADDKDIPETQRDPNEVPKEIVDRTPFESYVKELLEAISIRDQHIELLKEIIQVQKDYIESAKAGAAEIEKINEKIFETQNKQINNYIEIVENYKIILSSNTDDIDL